MDDNSPSIGVDLEGDERIGEPLSIIIEIQHRVEEGMAKRMVQRLVGVGNVKFFL